MLRRVFTAITIVLAAGCGGDSKHIDVRHPPKVLKTLAHIVPSKPVRLSEISGCPAGSDTLEVRGECVATIAASSSMMRKAHLHLVSGGFALLSYTPSGGSDAIRMKLTGGDPAEIPVRKAGGTLTIACLQCSIEPRTE